MEPINRPTIDDIIFHVSKKTLYKYKDMISTSKSGKLPLVRQVVMYLCYKYTTAPVIDIADKFYTSRTMVGHNFKVIENIKKTDTETADIINEIEQTL